MLALLVAASVSAQPGASLAREPTLPDLRPSSDSALDGSNTPAPPAPRMAPQADSSNQPPVLRTNTPSLAPEDLGEVQAGPAQGRSRVWSPRQRLAAARYMRKARLFKEAEGLLVGLLGANSPEGARRSALLELAALAQDQGKLSRAQDIYAQFLSRWPADSRAPEVLLQQGLTFRKMGLNEMALNKFYAVMTAALTLKSTQFDLYKRLVLQAQTEIAQTHYELGKYSQAAEFFTRLIRQPDAPVDRPRILYKLVRCYQNTTNYDEVMTVSQTFLARYPDAPEAPEVRFDLALALNELGRHNDALVQVMRLLKEESAQAKKDPASWAYWRRRAGNLIANQLYREGDYGRALEFYSGLAEMDPSARWQLPVWYQMGLTYEHLWQPEKALGVYDRIIHDGQELGTNAPPNLTTIVSMAQWRAGFLHWRDRAEAVNLDLEKRNAAMEAAGASTNSIPSSKPTAKEPEKDRP